MSNVQLHAVSIQGSIIPLDTGAQLYVSDISEEDAERGRDLRLFLYMSSDDQYVCQREDNYLAGDISNGVSKWRYAMFAVELDDDLASDTVGI